MTNHAENFPHSHAHLPASSASPTPPQQISADQLTAQVQAQPQSQPQAQAQAASTMDLRVRLLNGAVQPVRVPRGITIHKLRAELQTRGLIPPNLPARDVRLIHVPFSAAPPAAGRSGEAAGASAEERRTSGKEVAEASGFLGGGGESRPKVLSSKLLTVGECGVDSGDTLVITRIRAPTPCQLAAPDSSAETAAAAAAAGEVIPTTESIDRAIEAECARRGVPLPPPPPAAAASTGLGLHTTTAAAAAAAIAAAQRVRVVADPVLVDRLAEMGFPRLMARHALQLHRNRVAAAIEWLIENPDAEEQALQAESAAAADALAAPAGPGGRGGEGGGGGAAGEAGSAGAAGAGGAGEGAGGGDEGGRRAAAGGLASGDGTGVSVSAGGAGADAGATGAADSGAAGGAAGAGGEGAGVASGDSEEGLLAVGSGEAAEMDPPSSSAAVAASGGMMGSGVSGEAGVAAAAAGAAGAGAAPGAAAGGDVPMAVAAAAAEAAAVQGGVRAGTGEASALGGTQAPLQGDLPAELREAWAQIAGMHDERSVRAWNRMMALQTIMGASSSTSPSHLSSSSSLPLHEARDPFGGDVEGGEGGEEEAMDVEGAALWAMANEMLRHGLTNPRVRQAISDMQDNPHAIYTFLNDAEVGPILASFVRAAGAGGMSPP
ncbi:unnamed protein product [Closterium sp. NIES-64]|nr:unnamed protein product [Closterium sp. NIES-64]